MGAAVLHHAPHRASHLLLSTKADHGDGPIAAHACCEPSVIIIRPAGPLCQHFVGPHPYIHIPACP